MSVGGVRLLLAMLAVPACFESFCYAKLSLPADVCLFAGSEAIFTIQIWNWTFLFLF